MVGTIICEVGTIICDIGTINVKFYLLEVRYPHGYRRITRTIYIRFQIPLSTSHLVPFLFIYFFCFGKFHTELVEI
jgi:hypothetical protein